MREAVKPPALGTGDIIGLVSPAGTPFPSDKIQKSVLYLESLGYRVKIGPHAASEHGYLAGTDAERASDFNGMVADPQVKAIFATRGGYGTPRLLPLIDYKSLQRQPKIISGFSDITALQLAIHHKTGLVTFSGPMPAVEFWNEPHRFTEEQFWRLITSPAPLGLLRNGDDQPQSWREAAPREGKLLGGNLSLVVSLLGTPFSPSYRDALLVLEEVDEAPYRVDRMFTQLRNAGIISEIAGLILGRFTGCESRNPSRPSLTLEQIVEDTLDAVSIPVLSNLQYGHIPVKATLPWGIRARLDPSRECFEILEGAVSA